MLYIVSTPIWNLGDITYRAVETLKNVDIIACEDTRVSLILLKNYDIKKPLLSYHSYSNKNKTEKIIEYLRDGKNVALISDAWTPWISDPWYLLIKEALEQDIEIIPIPWVTAFSTALVWAGVPMNHFLYLWFLPLKKWRKTIFEKLSSRRKEKNSETIVVYESVHRLIKTIFDIKNYFWENHYIVVARELTKKFEEFNRGSVEDILEFFSKNPWKLKWEFVIIF